MTQRTIQTIERLGDGDRTFCFFIRPGSRSRPYRWFEVAEVPPFDGKSARFEMERTRYGWTFIRQLKD